MKSIRCICFIAVVILLTVSVYAQEWTRYSFSNHYSVSIPSTLELRRDSDIYTQVLNKIQNSSPKIRIKTFKNRIVFQQTGLSTNKSIYKQLYCRVLIDYYPCKEGEFVPNKGDTLELEDNYFRDAILAVNEENKVFGGGEVLKVISSGTLTLADSPATELVYIRQGMNGKPPVLVATYNIFNHDEYVKLTLSFRTNEAELWEQDLRRVRDSFKWTVVHDTNKPNFNFTNVKGLTAADRAQWEKDNIEQLNKMNYSSLDDTSKELAFKNAAFKNKFGNRSDYAQLKTLSPEKRDSLYMASPSDNIEDLDAYQSIQQGYQNDIFGIDRRRIELIQKSKEREAIRDGMELGALTILRLTLEILFGLCFVGFIIKQTKKQNNSNIKQEKTKLMEKKTAFIVKRKTKREHNSKLNVNIKSIALHLLLSAIVIAICAVIPSCLGVYSYMGTIFYLPYYVIIGVYYLFLIWRRKKASNEDFFLYALLKKIGIFTNIKDTFLLRKALLRSVIPLLIITLLIPIFVLSMGDTYDDEYHICHVLGEFLLCIPIIVWIIFFTYNYGKKWLESQNNNELNNQFND